jgi:hypothetical protein
VQQLVSLETAQVSKDWAAWEHLAAGVGGTHAGPGKNLQGRTWATANASPRVSGKALISGRSPLQQGWHHQRSTVLPRVL